MPSRIVETARRRRGSVVRAHAQERSARRGPARHPRAMRAARIEPAGPPVEPEELEQPPSVLHRAQALANAHYPGKRRLTNAYDDRVCKRRNTDSLFGTPWDDEEADGLEKPGYESLLALSAGHHHSPAQNPIGVEAFVAHLADITNNGRTAVEAMGAFGRLPFEIRSEIFRYVLIHQEPINVLKGWSLVYIRGRPNLGVNLLPVCRAFYEEGLAVLYGENTFHYKIRDPPGSHRDTNAVVNMVFHEFGMAIPINKHGHLFRNIQVSIEGNRMHSAEVRENVAKALQKFLPGHGLYHPAQLRSVMLQVPLITRGALKMRTTPSAGVHDVPSADFFKRGSRVFRILENLNCQFIEIVGQDQHGLYSRAVIDRRPHFTQQSVDAGGEDPWANDVVAMANRKKQFVAARARLGLIEYWIRRMTLNPFRFHGPNALFQPYVPPIYPRNLESFQDSYRNSRSNEGPSSSTQEEPVVPGPSEYGRGVVTRSRGHHVILRTPITAHSSSADTDIDEDAQNYVVLGSEAWSDDGDGFDEYDAEYFDERIMNDQMPN